MRAEFLPLDAADVEAGVNLHVLVWSADGRLEAVVRRLAPSHGRGGDKGPRRFLCSCWAAVGMSFEPKDCEHVRLVEAEVAKHEPGTAP